jgi:hypothetical protein
MRGCKRLTVVSHCYTFVVHSLRTTCGTRSGTSVTCAFSMSWVELVNRMSPLNVGLNLKVILLFFKTTDIQEVTATANSTRLYVQVICVHRDTVQLPLVWYVLPMDS